MSSLILDFVQRWRAEFDEGYWYIAPDMQVVREWDRGLSKLPFRTLDELRNGSGNYFSNKEEAEFYASIFRSILLKRGLSNRAEGKGLFYYIDTNIPRCVRTFEWTDPDKEDSPSISLYKCGNYFLVREEAHNLCHLFTALLHSRFKYIR
ncbi:hypothetical protein [Bacteroides heparinolyticus]|uniref:Uncharacterized protein n=1 Tax=Porphyromonas loveana TaxID=1884669 RepID=A0A2U1FMH2_9PORP|nr:hypothetical protein C7382_10357 [Porphyromonas loveana]